MLFVEYLWAKEQAYWETANRLIKVVFSFTISPTLVFKKSSSIRAFRFSKLVLFGGITPFSRTRTALMMPAIPLDPSRWPIFDLTDPLCSMFSNWGTQETTFTYIYKGSSEVR